MFPTLFKYIIMFIILFMYLNSIKISSENTIYILATVIILSICLDLFMYNNYIEVIQNCAIEDNE